MYHFQIKYIYIIFFNKDGNEMTVLPVVQPCTLDRMYDAECDSSDRSKMVGQAAEMQFEANTEGLHLCLINL